MAPTVTNVDDPHLTRFDAPIDEIGVPACGDNAGSLLAGKPAGLRILSDEINRLADRALDVARAGRISFIDECEDIFEVATRYCLLNQVPRNSATNLCLEPRTSLGGP